MARRGHGRVPSTEGDFTLAGGVRATRQLLTGDPAVDGIFAANDLMAQGALLVLEELGLARPG